MVQDHPVLAALDDVVHRPAGHGADDDLLGLVGGEEEDLHLRLLLVDGLGGQDAGVHRLHLDVHEDDVAVLLQGQAGDLLAGEGGARHLHVPGPAHDVTEVLLEEGDVLGDHHPYLV